MKGRVSIVERRFATLATRLVSFTTRRSTLARRLGTLDRRLVTLARRVATTRRRVTKLARRVTKLARRFAPPEGPFEVVSVTNTSHGGALTAWYTGFPGGGMRATSLLTSLLMMATLTVAPFACTGSGDDSCATATAVSATDAAAGHDAASSDATLASAADAAVGSPANEDAEVDSAAETTSAAFLRVSNWSSDAPAVDFCVAPHGTGDFQGPVVANLTGDLAEAGVADAGQPALSFPGVSAYSLVSAAQYDARLVAAGAPNCSTGIIADATNLPPLGLGEAMTIALVGAAHPMGTQPALRIIGVLDDQVTPTTVSLRSINASPDLPLVDVGTVSGGKFTAVMGAIPFGFATPPVAKDAATPAVDPNGYITEGALTGTVFHVRPTGKPYDSAVSSPLSIAAGAIVTLVVVGVGAPAETDAGVSSAQLLRCVDNAGTLGNAGSCAVVTPTQ
jgi:hypothetical protein